MCFNTLIKCIDQEKIKLIGYNYCDTLQPRHWFQFADDTTITTATIEDIQALLNVFTKWCHWAKFKIRIDKCSTFGIKKNGKAAAQFKPYLKVNNEVIPPVEIDDSFVYLGKSFSYSMSCEKIKSDLIEELEITWKNFIDFHYTRSTSWNCYLNTFKASLDGDSLQFAGNMDKTES